MEQVHSLRVPLVADMMVGPNWRDMEDRQDTKDFLVAKKQWQRGGRKTISWDKLKAELGL
ncbi:MAG: hypothetical protein HY649_06040 [Acidobacteria bacterium]|nr:hypothetical protein [Acidobacteriota bacterium]